MLDWETNLSIPAKRNTQLNLKGVVVKRGTEYSKGSKLCVKLHPCKSVVTLNEVTCTRFTMPELEQDLT